MPLYIVKIKSLVTNFQIINHGICPTTLEGALSAASDYFELPMEEKIKLMSNDVRKPVRYGTSIRDGTDKFQFWRVFLKHYAYPLSDWLDLWPNNPPHYRYVISLLAPQN